MNDITHHSHAGAQCATAVSTTPFRDFSASIVHEVNQPIASMMLNAGAALGWLKRETPDLAKAKDSLQTIISTGKRAGEIMQGIRRLAQYDAPALAPVPVDGTIRETLTLLHSDLLQNAIVVNTHLGLEAHCMHADKYLFQQVLINLFRNAIDAMTCVDEGPRRLHVASRLDPGSATLTITVTDSGVGIHPEHAPHIFNAFVSNKPDGMGMGLAICRAVIEAHGGKIWCEAQPARGSAFHVRLPVLMSSGLA